jgi:HSP20 family protein
VTHISRERRGPGRSGGEPDDLRLLDFFAADPAAGARGDCAPPMDVLETNGAVEILMDVPGIPADALRLVFARDTLIISGRKLPERCAEHHAAFHLAERSFGPFTRAVRLTGAFDAGAASATLRGGELRIVLPRIDERRGREIQIPIAQP